MVFQNVKLVNSAYFECVEKLAILDKIKLYRASGYDKDIFIAEKKYLTYDYSLIELAEFISSHIKELYKHKDVVITSIDGDTILIELISKNLLIALSSHGCSVNKLRADFVAFVAGSKSIVVDLFELFDSNFRKASARVHWWYVTAQGPNYITVPVSSPPKIHDEFYPWLKNGVKKYFEEYLESDSPILFLSGSPGTGKSTLLRAMIYEFNLDCFVAYDNKLIESDAMFIDFLTGQGDLMILEDAENIVLPRKSSHNHMITRLLNVSDGVIRFPRKKIIFTTNDSDFANVDSALLRPGRCFDTKDFRELTFEEAKAAAKVAGLNEPEENRSYTLAELFNRVYKQQKRKVGF